ncbi:hypothetical protein AB6A40_001633 [Gnathostoma spinigerum]|uniref:Transmembrane protein 144 n=1 Tax=Gnathostoma spinigerum TaxID=75299 RepID=A0ABD6E4L8_9BILA
MNNQTTDNAGNDETFLLGIATMSVSFILFGSTFVPVKCHKMGDGIFIQFLMGIAIFMVGAIIAAVEGFPRVYPLAMVGGLFWAVANSMAIPLIRILGIALAPLIWNITACLMGWATSRFGLFGIDPQHPKSDFLNYIGLLLLVGGGIMFMFVQNRPEKQMNSNLSIAVIVSKDKSSTETSSQLTIPSRSIESLNKKNSYRRKRWIAIGVSLFCGLLYAHRTTPVIYIQDHRTSYKDAPSDGLSYAFSHFLGILLTTTTIFVGYCIFKKNKPYLVPTLTIPSLISGASWGVAMALLFVSNDFLSQTIAFPIITVMPGFVAALWSVFYFKEIQITIISQDIEHA